MATDGPGKYKGSKRRTAKPYDRPQGIFRRVTDSVTGLFGSLSGWLGADEDGTEETTGPASAAATSAPPGESFIFAQPPSTHRKPYRPIYPEEGEDIEVPCSSSSVSSGAQVSAAGPTVPGINLGASGSSSSSGVTSIAPTPLTRGLLGATSTSLGHPLPLISSTPYDQPLRSRPLMRPTPTSIDSGTESPLGTDFIMPPRRVGLDEETFQSLRMPLISEASKTSSPTANALPSLEKMSSSPVNAMPSLEETQRKRLREMDTDHNSSLGGDSISNRSLFSETSRASHPQLPAASKKPRFNVSAFSTSSVMGDRSLLSDSTTRPSPFYPWRTAYGGASANKRNRYQNRLQTNRAQIKPKPPPSDATTEDGGLSQAARRILDCLNNMSTPISDAKRIPTPSPGQRGSFLDSSYTATYYKHRPPSRNSGPPVTKLLTPTKSVLQPNLSKLMGGGSRGVGGSSSAAEISTSVASTGASTVVSTQQVAQAPAASKPHEDPPSGSTNPSQDSSSSLPKQQEQQTSNVLTTTPASSASIVSKPALTQVISKSTTETSFSFKSTTESSSAQPLFKFGESNKSTESVSSEKPLFRFGNGNSTSNATSDQDSSALSAISSRPSIHSSELASPISKAGGGKLKTKISDTGRASRINEDDDAPIPVLPAVSLTMSSLPKINFTSTQSNAVCASSIATTGFTFSAPQAFLEPSKAVLASFDDPKAFNELEFTFSTPQNLLNDAPFVNHTPGVPMFNSVSSNFQPKLKASASKSKLNAAPLKEGSILDVFKTNSVDTSLNEDISESSESTTTITNSLAAFIKKSGEWSCDTCMVTNKSISEKCVACETPKPGTSTKEAIKMSSNFTSSTPVVTNSLTAFMKKTNEWSCDTCMLTNNSSVDKCMACETPKPGTTVKTSVTSSFSAPSTFNAPAGFNFKKSSEWECSECLVSNKDSAETCVCCQSAKPGTKSQPSSVFSTGLSSSNSLTCDTDWKCETCLVQNIKDNKKCKECDTVKPSAVIGSQVITGNFKFGVGSTSASDSSSGGFKFGVSNSNELDAGSTGFSFGVNASSVNKDSIASKTTGFSFGIKPAEAESSQATTGFKFGVNSAESKTKEDKSENGGGFSFGVSQKTEQKTDLSSKTEVSFGSAGSNKTEDKSDGVQKSFSFGGATGGFALGGNTNGKRDESEKPEKDEKSSPFSFGSKPTENDVSSQSPAFQFSNSSSKDTTSTIVNSSETFSFGTSKGEEKLSTSAPSFSFGAKPTESPSLTFGGNVLPKANAAAATTANATFTFGSTAATTKEETSSPFGGKRERSGSDEPARKLPFGTSNTANSGVGNSTTSLFSFGSNNTKSGGVFGAAPASNPPAFGSPAPVVSAANPTPSFSFNSTAPAPAFGAAAVPSPMFGQGFGATNNNNNNNNPSYAFGQPAEKKASTGFDFGSVNNSAAPFAFGSSEPAASGPGLFQFGQSQPSNASSGGAPMFQFGSGAPSPQTPAFGAGGGDNMFSTGGAVTRSAGGQPDRRIKKKAVRRIPK